MPIEFHCEHCGHQIRAPAESAGKKGKCPHCQNVVYIPLPPEESGEIPLAPIDENEERRAKAAAKEAHDYARRLLRERSVPGETTKGANRQRARTQAPTRPVDTRRLIRDFVAAMADGRLQDADRCAFELGQIGESVKAEIDVLSSNELLPGDFPKLPRPVLIGFLKQLRARL